MQLAGVTAAPLQPSSSTAKLRGPQSTPVRHLLVGGVLGDGLGALGDGVFGQLTWKDEADRGLDLTGGERLRLRVGDELAGLARNAAEDVVHERVHDGHCLLGDAGVRVDLLEDLVDVHREGLGALLLALGPFGLLLGGGLLRRHCDGVFGVVL